MCELRASQIHKRKEGSEMKYLTSYWYTEANLQSLLMIWVLLIHSFINENEAREMKHFTNYWLLANAEINLQTVLMIHEAWAIENFRYVQCKERVK